MERRNFLKSLTASGVLAAGPMPLVAGTAAAVESAAGSQAAPVVIVCQTGLDGAAALAADIAAELRAAGLSGVFHIDASAGELADVGRIEAILASRVPARIVGVMDNAAAIVFQTVAADRGGVYLIETQHRVSADGTRHHFTHVGLDGAMTWSDRPGGGRPQLAGLYADVLVGRAPAAIRGASTAAVDGGTATALVSFVLKA